MRHLRARHTERTTYRQRSLCGLCWQVFGRRDSARRHTQRAHPGHLDIEIHTHFEVMTDWGDFLNTHTNSPTGGAAHWPTPVINNPITAARQQTDSVDTTAPADAGPSTSTARQAENQLQPSLNYTIYTDDVATYITGHTMNIPSDDESDLEDHSYITNNPNPAYLDLDINYLPRSTAPSPNLNTNPLNQPDLDDSSQELLDEFFIDPPRYQAQVVPQRVSPQPQPAVTLSDSIPDLINPDIL